MCGSYIAHLPGRLHSKIGPPCPNLDLNIFLVLPSLKHYVQQAVLRGVDISRIYPFNNLYPT